MKQIILIRHAATDLAGALCGHLDPGLNEAGQDQVAALVHRLRERPIGRIYTSDLRRAAQTAEAIAGPRGVIAISRMDLREISFGAWEGLRWSDVQAHGSEYPALGAPNGETWCDFRARVLSALHEIALDADAPDRIAVVTHLGLIRTALTDLANIDPHSPLLRQITYCSAYCFEIADQGWTFADRFQ